MKLTAYIFLILFAVTAILSFFSLIETEYMVARVGNVVRWNPEVADVVAASLTVLSILAAAAAILTKAVGFATPVIRREQRGVKAGLRAVPWPLKVISVLSLAYFVAVFAMVQTDRIKKIVTTGSFRRHHESYYYYPEGNLSEVATQIDRSEYRQRKAAWTRKITSLTMNVFLLSGCFLLSRANRRDPELIDLTSRGMSPGQIDDSMNL